MEWGPPGDRAAKVAITSLLGASTDKFHGCDAEKRREGGGGITPNGRFLLKRKGRGPGNGGLKGRT